MFRHSRSRHEDEHDRVETIDSDDSGVVELTDAVVILDHLFSSSATIKPPYPNIGRDPNPDFLPLCTRGETSAKP